MSESIQDDDALFRHCVHPVSFSNAGRFVPNKFLMLYDEPDGSILASLAWGKYLYTVDLVHGYGCRMALRRNESARAKGKFTEAKRQVYCGAYGLTAARVRALAATEGLEEILSADVIHHIENDEAAHTDLRIVLKSELVTSIESTKTAIASRLWNACAGPLRHICAEDKELNDHPSSRLIDGPRGPY